METGSISFRIFLYSAIWLVAALAVTAFLLVGLYSRALDNALSDTLEFHLETLAGVVLSGDGASANSGSLADPRFSRPASGWYWEIRNHDGGVVNFSPSLIGTVLPEMVGGFDPDNARTEVLRDGYGSNLRLIERRISTDAGSYSIIVAGNLDENDALIDDFRGQTFVVLGAVGLMLAIMSALVARFALRPIERLRDAIEQVREGASERIEGKFPREVAPLAIEVNQLLHSNTKIIERARSQVGNLAHGLKTPLAVLRNEASSGRSKLAVVVRDEAEKMASIVANYLDRARLSARTLVVGRKSDTALVVSRLVRVMEKLHPERRIKLQMADTNVPWFRGDESDLEEMVGNLIDNGCKWAETEVIVAVTSKREPEGLFLDIEISDDGPGIAPVELKKVARRGVRLDEKVAGSGLGLSIVTELSEVYGGRVDLAAAVSGGLAAKLRLPAVGRARR